MKNIKEFVKNSLIEQNSNLPSIFNENDCVYVIISTENDKLYLEEIAYDFPNEKIYEQELDDLLKKYNITSHITSEITEKYSDIQGIVNELTDLDAFQTGIYEELENATNYYFEYDPEKDKNGDVRIFKLTNISMKYDRDFEGEVDGEMLFTLEELSIEKLDEEIKNKFDYFNETSKGEKEMENMINGYIKLIARNIENNKYLNNFYIESDNDELYKVKVTYDKDPSTGHIMGLISDLTQIDKNDIDTNASFFVPNQINEISINPENFGDLTKPGGYNLGNLLEFNNDFAIVFENNMYTVSNERIFDILSLNKDNFIELVENLRNMNLQDVNMDNDIFEQYAQVKLDEEDIHFAQDLTGVKIKTDKFGNKLNAFGNYAEYDDIR